MRHEEHGRGWEEDDRFISKLPVCSFVFGGFSNRQTAGDSGKPGLSYITSHTHTHNLSVMCPITTPLPAPVFPFFLSPFLPVFSSVFFSRAHDALWHNETVKRSPAEAGAETKWGCGWV